MREEKQKVIDDGGSAFPACNEANVNGTMGISIRDYFAGQALAGVSSYEMYSSSRVKESRAEWCYAQADAMLEARKQQ